MSAAQPLAFLLAALALPLVLGYLHRRKRVRTQVPSIILFRGIAGEATPRRSSLAHPRHLLSLLLMVLALLAAVHAVADVRADAEHPHDFVIVLDTSTSMGAVAPNGQTRLEDAVVRLSDLLAKLAVDDRVALVTMGAQTRVRVGLTRDHARIFDVASAQQPSWCGVEPGASDGPRGCAAQAEDALRIADAMCRRSRGGSVVLISDGVGVSIPSTQCPIRHVRVGQAGPNVGITGLAVREADALGLAEIYVQLTATGPGHEVEVELYVDDTVVDVLSLDVPAQGQVERLHRLELPPGEHVTAALRHAGEDVLAADDVARTPRRAGQRVAVMLVAQTRRSFAAEALKLHPRVDLTVIGPHDPPPTRSHDLLVLETSYLAGPIPAARRIVALGTPPEELGLQERGRFAAPEIVRWSVDDPLLRFVDLEGLALPRATTLVQRDTERALIDSDEGVLAALGRWNERDILYLGFAPAESDLVLRVGFVNFIANVVEWAAPAAEARPHEAAGRGLGAALPPLESRIDPPARLGGTITGTLGMRSSGRRLWQFFVLVALGLMTLEWLLPTFATRRVSSKARYATAAGRLGP
jgi:hypothetical protein